MPSLLATEPLATILETLFQADENPSPESQAEINAFVGPGLADLMASKTEYHRLYSGLKSSTLAVSRNTAHLLYALTRGCKPRAIIEFGTSFGVSTLCMAAALRENGSGRLITTEFEPSKAAKARQNLEAAGLGDLVEIRQGDALTTLADNLPPAVDLLLLDGAKGLYPDILKLVEKSLTPGALVVADDAQKSPGFIDFLRAKGGAYVSVPAVDGVEVATKIG
ncbi:MAG: class I SAM-dependent methyltransferase [Deltaproteobacteria bacterium]|jgi:predicted O-methyltransferase YrrM|nr:class I SAM-dependent methyltransferase [Deltaproteobacteria bacterium]